MIVVLSPLTSIGTREAPNPIHDSAIAFTDGTVPITGTMTPIMVHSIRGFNNPNTVPITPHVMPDIERTEVATIGDGGAPTAPTTAAAAPTPTANFEGLHTTVDCIVPPDSDGAVGPTYYAAFVNNNNNCATQTPSGNVGFYCKAASGGACTSQGALAAAFYYPNLFSGLSTNCNDSTKHSDPQVVYDSAKDRYLFVDITIASPFQICVAATLSNNPIGGSYCVASYASLGGSLPDYEKIGVWPDGLYVSYNPSGNSHTVVINKDDLEACRTIRTQDFDMGSDTKESDNQCTPQPNHVFRPDPATYNIITGVPAAGEPAFIVASYCLSSSIYVFTLHVDWSNSANSLLTRARIVTQTQNFAPSTVASPGNAIDTLRLHTMVPAPYFKDNSGNESVWTTITSRGSSTSLSAIAWYQFRVANNAPGSTTVANQNIWNPGSTSRLQAAAAFDHQGDVLMDYTQVSSSQDPAVAYAGRLASDPANTLGQTETILFRGPSMGSGACGTQNPCHRWGDYSSNFIDPDGCTFWFTHEYYPGTDVWQWNMRIGATRYSSCTPLTYSRTVSPTSLSYTSSGIGVTTAAQSVTVTNTGTGPLVLQAPTLTGTNPGDFSVSSDNCSTAPAGIATGTSCTIQVTCTPSVSGTRTATLNIMTNMAATDSMSVSLSCSTSNSLTAPTTSVSPSTIDSGQSSTLSTNSSFSGGTSPYTCQWLQKAPGAGSYSNLGGSFSCNAGDKPTSSTGTLSTTGAWSFELQVTDSSGPPVTVTSNVVTVTVNTRTTSTTVTPNPSSVVIGNTIAFTVTVTDTDSGTSSTPIGTAIWSDNGAGGSFSNGGSCTLSAGSCTIVYTPPAPASETMTATYGGDTFHSVSSGTSRLTVTQRTTSTTVSCTSPVVINQGSACTATVTDTSPGTTSTPTGTVSFSSTGATGTFSPTSCTLSSGSCSVTFTPSASGSTTVTGSYGGDSNHGTSSGTTSIIMVLPSSVSFSQGLSALGFNATISGSYNISASPSTSLSGPTTLVVTNSTTGAVVTSRTVTILVSFGNDYTAKFIVEFAPGSYTMAVSCVLHIRDGSSSCVLSRSPDINNDKVVNILDVAYIAFYFGTFATSPTYSPIADLNGDGIVSILDVALAAFYFQAPAYPP